MNLYEKTCFECSKLITENYSTSFSQGIKSFHKRFRFPIYAIYGFVRYADEIVDTFHDFDKQQLIADFRADTFKAIKAGISINPVLQSFQLVVNQYHIDNELIDAFLQSMEMDLQKQSYNRENFNLYIYGSAEVVGLMCLRIFCEGNDEMYQRLLPKARSLGAAFQKINFLRDVKADLEERGRTYFPGVNFADFTEADKKQIEEEIGRDFSDALEGIRQLPDGVRSGVYVAYIYYLQLFKKISKTPASVILQKRIRVSDTQKAALFIKAMLHQKLKVI
ncbi:phytoene/squalene synthase family protein [Mucilaginibacter sp. KACC 22063]|uniref:phytoene/squalene synthase family protein n=1 Tax=Mucilaginibacter sp. KACC 22063 TaxID=3025666 RepID=UPI0023670F0E|nr:phytoene/squalene synthase family protein [Mucilaginibacter sp. KACC 22063]WDF56559.1 phytoene/squalene synthase family protein [Mucilaginibacter sp. KACC 22063]